jgi:hypothetical protein
MSEAKPKIEGAKKFRRPMRAAGQLIKKEFVTKVLGLESHTFDWRRKIRGQIQEDGQCGSQLHTERV